MIQNSNLPDAEHTDRRHRARQRHGEHLKWTGLSTRASLGGPAVIVALVLVSSGCGTSPTDSAPAADGTSPAAANETKPEMAAVPRLKGLNRAEANDALRRAGLSIGAITRQPSSEKAGTVLRQGTSPGTSLDPGSAVPIIVAAPLPKVPSVVGSAKATAVSKLKAAGFSVQISTERTTSGEDNVVISQSPSGGSRAKPGANVTLVISDLQKPPTLSSAGNSNCTPGYSPCLPPASDYDCEGGSGDGPKYTGLVQITGSDPYDLDRDGDGTACEPY